MKASMHYLDITDKLDINKKSSFELEHGQEAVELLIKALQEISDKAWECQNRLDEILIGK